MKILALDLGKSKSVACMLDTQTHQHRFETIKTVPFEIQDLLARKEKPVDSEQLILQDVACWRWLGGLLKHYKRRAA